MSDLFQGQTMTYIAKFISAGTAHTFTFPFQPDEVVFYNYTKSGTSDTYVESRWFRGFPAGDAIQQGLGTSPAAKMTLETTNGFTVADTLGGPHSDHATISGITAADPVVVTHSAYTFQTDQIVRFTDLGNCGLVDHGMAQLNNNRYKIVVLTSTTFSLKDVITGEPVDGTTFTAYVSGGRICLETNVISLNNPQVYPYAVTPYVPNPYVYLPVTYQLLVGSAVMGLDGDVFYITALKAGQWEDLGDLLT